MCHAGGNGAFAQTKTLDQSQTNTPAGMMSLNNNQLEQVTSRVRDNLAVMQESLFAQMGCSDLSRLDTDDFNKAGFARNT